MASGGGGEEGEHGEVWIGGEVERRAGRAVDGIGAVDGGRWRHLEECERWGGDFDGVI